MSFYHAPTYTRVIGTKPYLVQNVKPKVQAQVETEQPQETAKVKIEPEYHSSNDLPQIDYNLNKVRELASDDILKDLDQKVSKKPMKKSKRK